MPQEIEPRHRMHLSALPLRKLALAYALGALLLVLITVAIGGTGLYLWQQASRESVRIDSLVEETQGMRGSLYRQMKEVFDALFLDDPDAPAQYRAHQQEVESRLAMLTKLADTAIEREGIQRLGRTYGDIRSHTDGLIENWPNYSLAQRRTLLEGELERGSLQSYEAAFAEIENQLTLQQLALQQRRAALVWISALLLSLPIVGAVALLLSSPWVLRRVIIEPLYSVQQATEMISRGKLDHRVPQVGARDCRVSRNRSIVWHRSSRKAARRWCARRSRLRWQRWFRSWPTTSVIRSPVFARWRTGLGIPFAVKVFDVHGATVRFESASGHGHACDHCPTGLITSTSSVG